MIISGLQKLTLLDYPTKIACTVFTSGCNFRCPFCHNATLVLEKPEELMSEDDFFAFLKLRKGMLQGVCVTGGEPTLQKDLCSFLGKIKALGYSVKLDTNGYRPDVLKKVVEEKLCDYVAMDIKNSQEKYGLTTGIENFNIEPIKESVNYLLQGNVDFEFRTTVVKELHTEEDILKITEWIKGAPKYFLQGFVDSGDIIKDGFSGYSQNSMENMLKVAKTNIPNTELRGV